MMKSILFFLVFCCLLSCSPAPEAQPPDAATLAKQKEELKPAVDFFSHATSIARKIANFNYENFPERNNAFADSIWGKEVAVVVFDQHHWLWVKDGDSLAGNRRPYKYDAILTNNPLDKFFTSDKFRNSYDSVKEFLPDLKKIEESKHVFFLVLKSEEYMMPMPGSIGGLNNKGTFGSGSIKGTAFLFDYKTGSFMYSFPFSAENSEHISFTFKQGDGLNASMLAANKDLEHNMEIAIRKRLEQSTGRNTHLFGFNKPLTETK
jgi:hypothetical protein